MIFCLKSEKFLAFIMLEVLFLSFFSGAVWPKESAAKEELNVFVAASLANVMQDVVEIFEKTHDAKVNLNIASSNVLRSQIQNGANCDIFLSANAFNIQSLVRSHFVDPLEVRTFAKNVLVVIAQKSFPLLERFEDLEFVVDDFLALADPDNAPAGIYAKAALKNVLLWDKMKDVMAFNLDVRATLAQVEMQNCSFGIVYRTDALISKKVKIVFEIPEEYHPPIVYRGCLIKNGCHKVLANSFFRFMSTKPVWLIFEKYGFKI